MYENDDIDQINQQIAALVLKKNALQASRKQEVIAAIKKQIAEYDLTARELGFENLGRALPPKLADKPIPKYANPDNPSQTWGGGRGAKPIWVRAHLEKGGALEDLLIK